MAGHPKKPKLKSSFDKPLRPGLIDELFSPKEADLVPLQKTKSALEETADDTEVTASITKTKKPPVHPPQASPRKKKKQSSSNAIQYSLAVLILLILGFAIMDKFNPRLAKSVAETEIKESEGTRERVNFYRDEIGHKLNRERLNVVYQNMTTGAPSLGVKPAEKEPDLLIGVPLAGESHHRDSTRDSRETANLGYADSHVQALLEEQSRINDWESQAQKQYINEFIANAAKAGYKVRVDKNGVVTVVGRVPAGSGQGRNPNSEEKKSVPPAPSSSGSMQ